MNELFLMDEPDATQHVYLKRDKETFDLTYLQTIGLARIAGSPDEKMEEASVASNRSLQLIRELLRSGAHISW